MFYVKITSTTCSIVVSVTNKFFIILMQLFCTKFENGPEVGQVIAADFRTFQKILCRVNVL